MRAQSHGPQVESGSAARKPSCQDRRRLGRFLVEPGEQGGVVQVTVYFSDGDGYLLRLVDEESRQERKSRSAVILSIVEEHFEKGRLLGEILVDLGVLSEESLAHALDLQRSAFAEKLLGEVLATEQGVAEEEIQRALQIQKRFKNIPTTVR